MLLTPLLVLLLLMLLHLLLSLAAHLARKPAISAELRPRLLRCKRDGIIVRVCACTTIFPRRAVDTPVVPSSVTRCVKDLCRLCCFCHDNLVVALVHLWWLPLCAGAANGRAAWSDLPCGWPL